MLNCAQMNTINDTAAIEESLNELTNQKVVVKLMNGRVISGLLKRNEGTFTIKLGTKHILVEAANLKKVIAHP